jgi:alpha-tubulin suppressor-like RCC1 family protein
LAIKTNGTLWSWGDNTDGELGNGTKTDKLVPTQVGTETNWADVKIRYSHVQALKTNGTLYAWGYNSLGQLGTGTNIPSLSPIAIGTDSNWVGIAAGSNFSAALKTDGTLWTTGDNQSGNLGDGTKTNRRTYGQVSCTALSVNDFDTFSFQIHPNPVLNRLTIENPKGGTYKLQVINQLGQQVLKEKINASSASLHVSTLAKGLYFLYITSENGKAQTIKFIKK